MAADDDEVDDYRNSLPANSVLEDYRIKRVLGAGGFGLTYLARDLREDPESPARNVAVKEYLPFEIATRMPEYDPGPRPTANRSTASIGCPALPSGSSATACSPSRAALRRHCGHLPRRRRFR